ncbi:DUF4157 domain-containing protein [Streptomyces sp. NPDC014995]|uniref:eCIS core domain-containing protein n=1 Tax=Streptomyces sp. NPDC014995 TaxID=3364936 RepID=UPI0036FC4641
MRTRDNARQPDPGKERTSARPPAGGSAPLQGIPALQGTAGNAAVVQLLRRAGHAWAQEQHEHGAGCGHRPGPPSVQRSAVHDVLRGGGRPLDDSTRTDMEARFGADFSDVRIHNDSAARASAVEVGARAYTSGNHIVIGDDGADRHTLAHELTHVVQQRQGPVAGTDNGAGLRISDPSDRFEREAEATAARVLRGPAPVQRQASDRTTKGSDSARTSFVQRMPSEAAAEPPVAIIQPGYASGDQFAVAAMLMHDPARHVYLTFPPGERKPAENVEKFYLASGITADRIHLVEVGPSATAKNAVGAQYKEDFKDQGAATMSGAALGKKFIAVGDATKYVGDRFSDEMRGEVRAGWGLAKDTTAGHPQDAQVEKWLAGKGVDAKGKTIAVLWSRFSGKKGEVHIEHDSSYVGMAQIIAGLSGVDTVLIVGDAAPKAQPQRKYGAVAGSYGNEGQAPPEHEVRVPDFGARVVDLTEFWKDPAVKDWGGDSRTGQFLVFDYLHRSGATRHLGFRSGNLEAMALMGFTVRYMEEPDSAIGGSRMEAWHAVDGTDRTKGGGMAPGYERLRVSAPPTRSGKYQKSLTLDEQKGDQKHADWHRAPKAEYADLKKTGRDPDGASLPKGFAEEDLANIDAYLVTGRSEEGLAPELIDGVRKLARDFTAAEDRLLGAEDAAKKARAVAEKAAVDPKKKESVKLSLQQKAEELTNEESAVRASSESVMEAARQEFRALCARHGLVEGLRARNLYASNIAHRLSPGAPA